MNVKIYKINIYVNQNFGNIFLLFSFDQYWHGVVIIIIQYLRFIRFNRDNTTTATKMYRLIFIMIMAWEIKG